VPTEQTSRWLEPQRRSRARRVAGAVGMIAASLAIAAGGAQAQGTGGTTAGSSTAAVKVTVKQIQHALGIKADGAMGPQTKRALKRFQRAHHLRVTGVANADTLAALGLTGTQQNSTLNSAPTADPATVLAAIAQCESQGDIHAVSPNGRYFGKYQFSQATWESLGGTGSPADADEPTQDLFAARLYEERGLAPWPACSAQLTQS
jgi:peptidoglycan hydrolase-like protein with peptidoglycan-binding domain